MRPNSKILNLLRSSSWVVPLLVTSSCVFNDMKNTTDDMAKDTHDMREKTADVAVTTNAMAAQTKELTQLTTQMRQEMQELRADTTEQLKKTVLGLTDTYADLRQKEAVDMRTRMLDTLEKTTSSEAKMVIEAKAVPAATFCMAFEFQLWKDNLNDTPEYLDLLFGDAMEEFLNDMKRYMQDPNDPLDPTSSNAQMQNLMAIAATIDRTNTNAKVLAKKRHEDPTSIWSLMESALDKADRVENGEISHDDLKPYEQQVLKFKSEAVAILQARANILPLEALSLVSDIENHALPVQAWMVYHGSTAQFDSSEAMRQSVDYLTQATKEISFLRKHGYSARINGSVKSVFNNLTVPDAGKSAKTLSLPKNKQASRISVETALAKAITDFKTAINVVEQ